jgi:hypothetical protein
LDWDVRGVCVDRRHDGRGGSPRKSAERDRPAKASASLKAGKEGEVARGMLLVRRVRNHTGGRAHDPTGLCFFLSWSLAPVWY